MHQKICDQISSQLFFRVRCWDAFFVLWNSPKVARTSTMESIHTFILSVWNRLLELCVSASNLHTIFLKIYPANRNEFVSFFSYATPKNGMLQLYQQSINTGFTSIVCNWKKVQCNKLMEGNETIVLQIKFKVQDSSPGLL